VLSSLTDACCAGSGALAAGVAAAVDCLHRQRESAAGLAVGSVNGGSLERAAIFDASPGGAGELITVPATNGSFMTTAFGVNTAGLVCGSGIDPGNAARNAGLVHDLVAGTTIDIGGLPGRNGALPFAMSEAGHVAGSSMQNQGSGVPFIWTAETGMQPVPLPAGTSQGAARGVNSAGIQGIYRRIQSGR